MTLKMSPVSRGPGNESTMSDIMCSLAMVEYNFPYVENSLHFNFVDFTVK